MHIKHLGWHAIIKDEELKGLAPKKYGIHVSKAVENKALNTRIFYGLIRLKHLPATSILEELVSNYYLVLHSITHLSLKILSVSKEPILMNNLSN